MVIPAYFPLKKPNSSLWICIALAVLTGLVFSRVLTYDFINCDDDFFVSANPVVSHGLTGKGVVEALTDMEQTFYYPLTLLSFMVDVELYGSWPGGFHLTNLLLHTGSVLLLFLLLRKITGSLWCSAFTAAVFAVHPLHVESVAWIAERKDVLSGVFFMLTLYAYIGYVRRSFSIWRYLVVMGLFTAGLLAKPMAVTLPVILLLLDGWPFDRLHRKNLKRILVEKIPLLGISVLFSAITLSSTTTGPESTLPSPAFGWRVGNALISSVIYIWQSCVPRHLAMPIPQAELSAWGVTGSMLVLVMISVIVFLFRRKQPWLLCGWLWYLIMLLPVSGVIRFLGTARADRFTYLPQIGLCMMLVWTGAAWAQSRLRRRVLIIIASFFLAAMSVVAYRQAGYWKNSETLWIHTLQCTSGNTIAHNNLGVVLGEKGDINGAVEQFQKTISINPNDTDAWFNLGFILSRCDRLSASEVCFRRTLTINPDYDKALKALGAVLILQEQTEEGIVWTRRFLELHPDDASALNNLQAALLQKRSPAP